MKVTLKTLALAAALTAAGLVQAQDIRIDNIVELSAHGTPARTMLKNGLELAIN